MTNDNEGWTVHNWVMWAILVFLILGIDGLFDFVFFTIVFECFFGGQLI